MNKEKDMAEKKPEARVVSEVCSMCGLDWKRHGAKPTTETCIRLLASDLAAAEARANRPLPLPYPVYPYRPYWGTVYPNVWTTVGGTTVQGGIAGTSNINYNTSGTSPQMSSNVPRAIAA